MKSIRYYSAIFLICVLLAGCGTSSVYLPEDIPSENNSLKKTVALDGVTTIYGRHLPIMSAIYSGGAP